MTTNEKKQPAAVWVIIAFIFWLIVNIRVEAGFASALERALDGIVGGALLLSIIFLAFRFFKCKDLDCEKE